MSSDLDKEAILSSLYAEHYEYLIKWCLRYTSYDPSFDGCIEDFVQEAFYAAVSSGDAFVSHPHHRGWLITTCRNKLDNHLKRKKARRKHIAYSIFDASGETVTRTSNEATYK